jgi:hypothetical protein
MKYLNLADIKRQCIVDENFHDDDELLYQYGAAAENLIEQEIDMTLEEVCDRNGGDFPALLYSAALMICDFLYGGQRGSDNSNPSIPEPVLHFCRLYRQFN